MSIWKWLLYTDHSTIPRYSFADKIFVAIIILLLYWSTKPEYNKPLFFLYSFNKVLLAIIFILC